METLITGMIATIVSLWLGSLEWRLKNMDARLRAAPSRAEVNSTIDLKQEAIKVMQKELKDDIHDMKRHIEAIRDAVCPMKR